MQSANSTTISRLVLVGCIVALAVLVAWGSSSPAESDDKPQGKGANVPQKSQTLPVSTVEPDLIPMAEPTIEQPLPGITPTEEPEPTSMPTPVPLAPALLITPTVVSEVAWSASTALTVQNTGGSTEPIHYMTWAPTGDKLVYATNSGKLYWSNLDGTDATLIHAYDSVYAIWGTLHQSPMTNTLLVPGYAIRFAPGRKPILDQAPDTWKASQLGWWGPDRVSGVAGPTYDGNEKLVTLDANGRLVGERSIPYMSAGAVQPGGEWLAYSTEGHRAYYAPDPAAIYLLNLNTGERLEVAGSGKGYNVGSWSPDGKWFYVVANLNGDSHGAVISADGREQIVVTPPGGAGNAVWSPDSTRLAFSKFTGGRDHGCGTGGDMPPCETSSESYVVDLRSMRVSPIENAPGISGGADSSMLMHPSWSPDGSLLAFLSFSDSDQVACSGTGPCSSSVPAFYLLFAR